MKPLRALIVEDSEDKALLLLCQLRRAGYGVESLRVETLQATAEALDARGWDVVLSDYRLPSFSALDALALVKERGLEIPFIISETTGEAAAVEAMLAGASDCLMKGSLTRLGPAIERALKECENRRARRRAEAELRESEERYRELFENAYDLLFMLDLAGNIITVNRASERILGVPREQMVGRNVASLVAPEHLPLVLDKLAEKAAGGGATTYEIDIILGDGRRATLEVNSRAVVRDGVPVGVQAIARDITHRKQAEAALRVSEDRYRDLVEHTQELMCTHDLEGRLLSVNPWAAQVLGYDRAKVIGKNIRDILTPESRALCDKYLAEMRERGASSGVMEVETAWGERRLWKYNNTLRTEGVESPVVRGMAQDITERRRAEAERRIISEIVQGVITTPNLDELFKLIHRSIGRLIYAENCFIALREPSTDLVHFAFWADKSDPMPEPLPLDTGFAGYVLRTGSPLLLTDEFKEQMYAEGQVRRAGSSSSSWMGVPLRTPARTIGVLVVQHYEVRQAYTERDLDFLASVGDQIALAIERKRSEEALRRAEEKYRSIFEHAVEGMFQADPDGNYTAVNPALVRMLGYDSAEDLRAGRVFLAPDNFPDTERGEELRRALYEAGEAVGFECELLRKDGTVIWASESARAIRDENGAVVHYEGSVEDITERKQLEEQFRQSQKLEAVGRLAGGVAHDFNNLLTIINGYADLSLRKIGDANPLRPALDEIRVAAERAASLTRQLLAFSRKQVLQPRVLNLNAVLADVNKMLRRLIGEDVRLRTVLASELSNVRADPGQLEQVLMNLAVNARDAMPRGGELMIETQNVYLDEEYARQHVSVDPGRYVMLAVTDTGYGMDAETQSRIFEPFFTTKEMGKGTGLGLSTVYGIVKQSGGNIWVYSEPGRGTSFKIYLPAAGEEADAFKRAEARGELPRGEETILLVEDEELVRKLTREVLESSGYRVIEADCAAAALSLCEKHTGEIQLLLTDVVMPGASGRELAGQLLTQRPGTRVLFMSGYASNAIIHHGTLAPDINYIQKPFSPDDLTRKVRDVLDGPLTSAAPTLKPEALLPRRVPETLSLPARAARP